MADETNTTSTPIEQPPSSTPQMPVTPAAENKKMFTPKPLIAIFIILIIIFVGIIFAVKYAAPAKIKVQPTATVAPRPTPTPERILSPVASQSAFLALDTHVASLSAGINNFILDDPQLTPPVLDLPLGF